jgi:hypothetical protein
LIIKATRTRKSEHLLAASMVCAPNKFSKKSTQGVIAWSKYKTLLCLSSSIVVGARARKTSVLEAWSLRAIGGSTSATRGEI